MANNTTGFGFKDAGRTEGGSPTAGLKRVSVASTDARPIFTGDPVRNSSAIPGVVEWSSAAGLGNVEGIFYGCKYHDPNIGRVIWSRSFPGAISGAAAGDRVEAYIMNDPERWLLAKSSGTFVAADVGKNISFTPSSVGDAAGGSLATLAIATLTGLSSGVFRIVDLYRTIAPSGADGADAAAGNVVVVTGNTFGKNVLTTTTS